MAPEEIRPGSSVSPNSLTVEQCVDPQVVTNDQLAAERSKSDKIDAFESKAINLPQITGKRTDLWPEGMYVRILEMPQGSYFTSQIHKTQHPWFALSGVVSVYTAGKGWNLVCGGDFGITEPGTRRLLIIHETATWATVHLNPDNKQDLDAIFKRLILPHDIAAAKLDETFVRRLEEEGEKFLLEQPNPFAQ